MLQTGSMLEVMEDPNVFCDSDDLEFGTERESERKRGRNHELPDCMREMRNACPKTGSCLFLSPLETGIGISLSSRREQRVKDVQHQVKVKRMQHTHTHTSFPAKSPLPRYQAVNCGPATRDFSLSLLIFGSKG